MSAQIIPFPIRNRNTSALGRLLYPTPCRIETPRDIELTGLACMAGRLLNEFDDDLCDDFLARVDAYDWEAAARRG